MHYVVEYIILSFATVVDLNVYFIYLQDSHFILKLGKYILVQFPHGLDILQRYYSEVTWHKICLHIILIKNDTILLLPLCKSEMK